MTVMTTMAMDDDFNDGDDVGSVFVDEDDGDDDVSQN